MGGTGALGSVFIRHQFTRLSRERGTQAKGKDFLDWVVGRARGGQEKIFTKIENSWDKWIPRSLKELLGAKIEPSPQWLVPVVSRYSKG